LLGLVWKRKRSYAPIRRNQKAGGKNIPQFFESEKRNIAGQIQGEKDLRKRKTEIENIPPKGYNFAGVHI